MKDLLDTIKKPADLKKLPGKELNRLAAQLRRRILTSVAETGGHLAPNLGVVELTIALHLVYDSPRDKIIWDVGHQAYAHKILTGRNKSFGTLRQFGGLSGFPKRSESPHDVFETGHSSTSISAGLGMAVARDLAGEEGEVVAVIGDGSLTAGMALEGLNNAGNAGKKLTVVLNDNSMSIASNVGALPSYLSRIRTDPTYYRVKADIEAALRKMPRIGPSVAKVAERIKDSLKYLVVPGVVFEELGFTYLGPVDGHNISALCRILRYARQIKGPVLVHVYTVKGKGYHPAEENPRRYHGVGPFNVKTGEIYKSKANPTYTSVFGETLCKLAEKDRTLVAITAAMTDGTGLAEFARRFPERFFDVGIAEQHAVTFAAGLASQGMKPVVAIYSTFLQRAYDQVVHDVCIQNLPVVFALDRGGIVGSDGETHQGLFDYTYLRHIPGMTVMAPKDENELVRMVVTAVAHSAPVAIRYPRGEGLGVPIDAEPEPIPMGKAEVLAQGEDVAIVAIGSAVPVALAAGKLLKKEGIKATVVNARFVKPLDEELLERLAESIGKLITVEEHVLQGGFGSAVLEYLAQRGLHVPVKIVALPDEFIPHGSQGELRARYGLTPEAVADAARKVLNTPSRPSPRLVAGS